MRQIAKHLAIFASDERGATVVEYGLICALIIVIVLAGMNAVADANDANYELITDSLVG